jgi:hypothetical protein
MEFHNFQELSNIDGGAISPSVAMCNKRREEALSTEDTDLLGTRNL